MDEVLMLRKSDGNKFYYHANHLYSVHAVTNGAGNIVEAVATYDAYGKPTILTGAGTDTTWFTGDDVTASTSTLGNPWFYTGQRLDAETGLMYYKNRYYSAELGRFVSRDLLRYDDAYGLYIYARGMVTKKTDQTGLGTKVKFKVGEVEVEIDVKPLGLEAMPNTKTDDALGIPLCVWKASEVKVTLYEHGGIPIPLPPTIGPADIDGYGEIDECKECETNREVYDRVLKADGICCDKWGPEQSAQGVSHEQYGPLTPDPKDPKVSRTSVIWKATAKKITWKCCEKWRLVRGLKPPPVPPPAPKGPLWEGR